ncbi:hypothetical protein BJ085DRAFT_12248, partial [Dimargaris cristalligena]
RIITQNENGPCPLIAICNVLILRQEISIEPASRSTVTFDHLVQILADKLPVPTTEDTPDRLSSLLTLLPQLERGLDVNVHFHSIHSFESTPELALFVRLGVPLVHGWLPDVHGEFDLWECLVARHPSYNKAVECLVRRNELRDGTSNPSDGSAEDADMIMQDGTLIEDFLSNNPTQLTYHGLVTLSTELPDHYPVVFFRNNHFSTLYKRQNGELYLLVTDTGYAAKSEVVWESLRDIDQDGSSFFNARFQSSLTGDSGDASTSTPHQ